MPESNWSQFFPDLVVQVLGGIFFLFLLGIVAYLKSDKFKKWFNRICKNVMLASKWLISKWHLIFLNFLVILGIFVLRVYADMTILAFSLVCYWVGLLSWGLTVGRPLSFGRSKSNDSKTGYLPIPLIPGIGNSYLSSRYIAPPSGNVFLAKVEFQFQPDALIFDTNEHVRYYRELNDGGKEIDFQLPKPQGQVRSAYFLINSTNSKSIYAHREIGEIRLVFKDAPPIVVALALGENIRDWCPGDPGDLVREAFSPMLTMDVWTGLNKHGRNAVIDCLRIPVYECMRNCLLERIVLIHKSLQRQSDTTDVHFSVFAVSLEIAQGM
jgi:hypothetical protein